MDLFNDMHQFPEWDAVIGNYSKAMNPVAL